MSQNSEKQTSAFYPTRLTERIRENAQKDSWAASMRDSLVEEAQPWLKFSDDELWGMMFGHAITRSWMVWSNGHCPACRGETPMYTWEIDALNHPWKVRCPHCGESFPKNDFYSFYRSGLDEHGVFDPGRADRSLLFNTEHPEPDDPLYGFGVDDGEGYLHGEKRWRFIGAYLVYGQWKQLVLGGIQKLSAAYVVSGERIYAHRAGLLLDRVADLYASFDFEKEGLAYERSHSTGYVSTWHDACEETRELTEAYDRIFEGIREDGELVEFLAGKAAEYRLENPKKSFADVQRNIEEGILREVLTNSHKIHSNYPRQENALLVIETVLGWPENRERVLELLDGIIAEATAVDGVTGEKGTAGYGTIGPQSVAQILGMFTRLDGDFLEEVYERHPQLQALFRFHVDTWCLGKYYPHVGDSGGFTRPYEHYAGVPFTSSPGLAASMYSFMGQLYELTGDAAFVQVLFDANGRSAEGLPYDLFAGDAQRFQQRMNEVIEREGVEPRVESINEEEWRLAILRSGEGKNARALWLHYDAGGRHSHADGMNLGFFARGMDLLPEFGYPPVQFGGWDSPRANWYRMTAGHNTVVVDGENQREGAGCTTLWADGEMFRGIRVSAPGLIGGAAVVGERQFERTALLVDISAEDAYAVDLLRVVGGKDHARFLHSGFGEVNVEGLELHSAEEYGHDTQMRNFCGEDAAQPGWSADWRLEDRYKMRPGAEVHLRYVDLTQGAGAYVAEAWVSLGYDQENAEAWIPRLMVRRQGEEPLASTFVGVLEPYEGNPKLRTVRRLPLETQDGDVCEDSQVAVEIEFEDGRRDLVVALDMENWPEHAPVMARQPEWGLLLEGELCWVRQDAQGKVERAALCRGSKIGLEGLEIGMMDQVDFVEVSVEDGEIEVRAGKFGGGDIGFER